MNDQKRIIVTGAAGFIGSRLSAELLAQGHIVTGIDNLNDYYDVSLKEARLDQIKGHPNFHFAAVDIADKESMQRIFSDFKPQRVVNLAAQAGVRYSLENPHSYVEANIVGFLNILEGCRHNSVEHLVFASSSSVYGLNTKLPFSVKDNVDHPISMYAATKKSNELMAHVYSHLFNVPATGLRFFTVYGPWGRPDMALFKFTKNILKGEPIDLYNYGKHRRDFTYIDDIVEGIIRVQDKPPSPTPGWTVETGSPATSSAPYRVFNIGNGSPVQLLDFITALEHALGIEAKKNLLPMQPGDVHATWADTSDLFNAVGYRPQVDINTGVGKFVDWYRQFYNQ